MYNSVTTNTYDSTWKSTGRALVECKWRHYVGKLKQFSKTTTKLNMLEKFTSMFGSQTRDTDAFRHSPMSSSRCYIQKHKQYTESNLMQYALSYRDAFLRISTEF